MPLSFCDFFLCVRWTGWCLFKSRKYADREREITHLGEADGFVEGSLFWLVIGHENFLTHVGGGFECEAAEFSCDSLSLVVGVYKHVLQVRDCEAVADYSREADERAGVVACGRHRE